MVAGECSRRFLPAEPLDAWFKEIRVLRLSTAMWDAMSGNDDAGLRRLLPHPKPDLVQQAKDFLERQTGGKVSGSN